MKPSDIYHPVAMMIFYKTQTSYVTSDEVYVEWASIVNGKTGAAVPLSSKAAFTFANMLSKSSIFTIGGFLPSNMIYTATSGDKPIMMWYTKPMKRKMYYDKGLHLPDGMISLPWLLWYFVNDDLYIYALDKQPAKESVIFNAPFHNVDHEGKVCLGGTGTKIVSKEFSTYKIAIDLCEAAFFGTKFTHGTHNNTVKGNMNSIHKNLIETGKQFPNNVLVKTKYTLTTIIERHATTKEGFDEGQLLDEYQESGRL